MGAEAGPPNQGPNEEARGLAAAKAEAAAAMDTIYSDNAAQVAADGGQ